MVTGNPAQTGSVSTLATAIERALSAVGVSGAVEDLTRLTGGASRETYRFTVNGIAHVLQRERGGAQRRPEGMAAEAEVVRAAEAGEVPVPRVIVSNGDVTEAGIGPSFFVTESVPGETIARRILRDSTYEGARSVLAGQMGAALAAVHAIATEPYPWLERIDELDKYRAVADELDLRRPAFEVAFRWLETNRPNESEPTLVHGDFRLGNVIVDEAGLAAVIDWELAHVGQPMEDLAWLCVRAWRFGGDQPVAGIGSYEELFDAYAASAGRPVDRSAVRWWEVLGSLKWGIMCGLQANAHLSGAYRSVELAAIGRRIAEQEEDVLRLIDDTERGSGR
jgi:aminoglycoside phosphotransferase (APT) family kinase protein